MDANDRKEFRDLGVMLILSYTSAGLQAAFSDRSLQRII